MNETRKENFADARNGTDMPENKERRLRIFEN